MEDVDTRYQCPVCQEVLRKPTAIAGCAHTFCRECIRQLPRSASDGRSQCPVCRLSFRPEYDLTLVRDMEREIATKSTKCRACHTWISLLSFDNHALNCSKRLTPPLQFNPLTQEHNPNPNRSTFQCPLCSLNNLDCKGLLDHINQHHPNSKQPVVCPVCASMPWGSSEQHSQNFVQHLNLRHQFEYDTFVDYDQDDDKALTAAIQASLRDNY